ncbi:MAG: 16S rRNA (cytidine(1402)-2'-O)-methyltransferase [Bacteroidales bacterium]|nr:16S rRNA (cytidine(1402)-2'-O)-methyltransferase [Bacteroidales bacterium]
MSKLYVVPTPVGNMGDITLRALEVLKRVSFVMAEDTRTTSILFKHFDIKTPLVSYHKFNEHGVVDRYADRIETCAEAALVSDAGTPAISDPGYLLVRCCIDRGIAVECLPGATALIPALVSSGLPADKFAFEGFLPQKKGRMTAIEKLKEETRTMILYESPYRLVKLLTQLSEALGSERRACVCREISKIHEEAARGTLAELITTFTERQPKGEIVVVVEGAGKTATTIQDVDETEEEDNE